MQSEKDGVAGRIMTSTEKLGSSCAFEILPRSLPLSNALRWDLQGPAIPGASTDCGDLGAMDIRERKERAGGKSEKLSTRQGQG
jgi:hypothetical protein